LHVLDTNHPAISFYRRNHYLELRFLRDFYYFDQAYHSAYLYILYLNGYKAPITARLWNSTRYAAPRSSSTCPLLTLLPSPSHSSLLESGLELLQSLLSFLPAPSTFVRSMPSAAGIFGTLTAAPSFLLERGDGARTDGAVSGSGGSGLKKGAECGASAV
jgi:hypothetical protein